MATILVVDHDGDERAAVCAELQAAGYAPRPVSAADAPNAVRQFTPDVVVANGDAGGVELVGVLRKQSPTVPVLLVIDMVSKEAVSAGLRARAAAYLARQSLHRELQSSVGELLSVMVSQRRRVSFQKRMAAAEYTFVLESDPDLVPHLVSHAELVLDQMQLFDDADRMRVGVAVHEAAVNAIVHGNLEIGSDLKNGGWDGYHRAIAERRTARPYVDRRVTVEMWAERRAVFGVRIADEGPGFDPAALPDPFDPANLDKPSGRGLLMIRSFFDVVEHSPTGNVITMTKRVEPAVTG